MNFESFKLAAESNLWGHLLPEIGLGVLALLLLVLEILIPKKDHRLIPFFSIFGQLAVLVYAVINYAHPSVGSENFAGMIKHSAEGQFMRVFFILNSLLVTVLGIVALAKQRMPRIEFFHIVLVVAAAMMLLVQSNHFVMFFVALETITVGFYILVSYIRTNPLSLEAGLKYLVSGALSSAILLFGIVLLYGAAGTTQTDSMHFGQLRAFLAASPSDWIANIGVVFVLAGVAFKVGAVPFQIWIPDVYQGAPTPVTAFLAVASKAAGISVLLLLCRGVFEPASGVVLPLLTVMTAATLIFGNVAALGQQNVKRLFGLSGVAHAGFLLLGVIAATSAATPAAAAQAANAVYFYLFVYLLASFAVFGVMTHVAGVDDTDQQLDHYGDLAKDSPFLAAVLAAGLGSLAGIPPLAGFVGKLMVFVAAYHAGLYWLLAIAILGVVVSIYYYFGWIKAAFFPVWQVPLGEGEVDPRPARTKVSPGVGLVMAVLALASIALGFYQTPITAWLAALNGVAG